MSCIKYTETPRIFSYPLAKKDKAIQSFLFFTHDGCNNFRALFCSHWKGWEAQSSGCSSFPSGIRVCSWVSCTQAEVCWEAVPILLVLSISSAIYETFPAQSMETRAACKQTLTHLWNHFGDLSFFLVSQTILPPACLLICCKATPPWKDATPTFPCAALAIALHRRKTFLPSKAQQLLLVGNATAPGWARLCKQIHVQLAQTS